MHCVPMSPWNTTIPLSVQLITILATLKLIQLGRKLIWRHLLASVVNAVNLKEIKQVVFG